MEVAVFFTFYGLPLLMKDLDAKVSPHSNPAMPMKMPFGSEGLQKISWPIPNAISGVVPGFDTFATSMMKKEMDKLDIPPVGEFVEMIHDAGGKLYACKATVDMFHLTPEDFCPQVEKVLTVGEFYDISAGGQIIFT